MFICTCGKEYKTEKIFKKHLDNCAYKNIDIKKISLLGQMINEVDRNIFYVSLGSINKYSKEHSIDFAAAKAELLKNIILKYKKSLWDILVIWQDNLLVSEYRHFLKWVWKTYKNIALISLKNILSNTKIIYRYNLEYTSLTIKRRIDESLVYIHEHGIFSNDFEFVNTIIDGNISIYFVLFNDWLATKWYARLDIDLQRELSEYVEIASKNILERLTENEFISLQQLASDSIPIIYEN